MEATPEINFSLKVFVNALQKNNMKKIEGVSVLTDQEKMAAAHAVS